MPTAYVSFSAEINPSTTESLIALLSQQANQGITEVYLMLSAPESPSFESTVPKRTKEFEHDHAPANGVPAIKLFCTQCGIQNSSNASFCWKCGHAMQRREDLG